MDEREGQKGSKRLEIGRIRRSNYTGVFFSTQMCGLKRMQKIWPSESQGMAGRQNVAWVGFDPPSPIQAASLIVPPRQHLSMMANLMQSQATLLA